MLPERQSSPSDRRLTAARWALFGLAAVAAAVAAVLQSEGAVLTAVVLAIATFVTAVSPAMLEAVQRRQAGRTADADRQTRLNEILVAWPLTLGDAHPFKQLRIHWSRKVDEYAGSGDLPPYIDRDRDGELREALASRQLVVVRGPSLAGKTRAAYEAARAQLGDDTLLILPRRPRTHGRTLDEAFGKLGLLDEVGSRNALLWLDDVDHYARAGELDTELMSRLEDAPNVKVLATIRQTEYESLADHQGAPSGDHLADGQRFLALAHVVHLQAIPSPEELDRAQADYGEEDMSVGIGAQLIEAPELVERLVAARFEHPHCHAVVNAAIDWVRTGKTAPIDRSSLFRLARSPAYRDGTPPGTTMADDELQKGLDRALRPLDSGVAMMYAVDDERSTFDPFDYLIAFAEGEVEHGRGAREVAGDAWDAALADGDAADALEIGWSAYWRQVPAVAERALRDATGDGEHGVAASILLSTVLRDTDRTADARELLESTLAALPPDDPELAEARSACQRALATIVKLEGNWTGALELVRAAVASVEGRDDLMPSLAEGLMLLAGMLNELEQSEEALSVMDRLFALMDEPALRDEMPFLEIHAPLTRGVVLRELGRLPEALADLRQALEAACELLGDDHHVSAWTRMMLATVAWRGGNAVTALELAEEAIEGLESYYGPEHPQIIDPVGTRGSIKEDLGDHEGALRDLDRAIDLAMARLGDDNELGMRFVARRGAVRLAMGDSARAVEDFEHADRLARRRYGDGHPKAVAHTSYSGWTLYQAGARPEAARLFELALAARGREGVDDRIFASAIYGMGAVASDDGNRDAAVSRYREALELFDPDDVRVPHLRWHLAEDDSQQGNLAAARSGLERALEDLRRIGEADRPVVREMLTTLATVCRQQGDLPGARAALEDVWGRLAAAELSDDHSAGKVLQDLGEVQLELGRHDAAAESLDRALEIERRAHGVAHPAVYRALWCRARLARATGDDARARALAELTLEACEASNASEPHVEVVLRLLGTLGPGGPQPSVDSLDGCLRAAGRLRRSLLEDEDLSSVERAARFHYLRESWPARREAMEAGGERPAAVYEELRREAIDRTGARASAAD